MAYFIGQGYSDAFSVHMAELLAEMRPESPIVLAVSTDAVCGACPNNTEGFCNKPDQVAAYDRAVLKYCKLSMGEILPFGEFTSRVEAEILSRGIREKICGDCQWNRLCSSQPSRWTQKK